MTLLKIENLYIINCKYSLFFMIFKHVANIPHLIINFFSLLVSSNIYAFSLIKVAR